MGTDLDPTANVEHPVRQDIIDETLAEWMRRPTCEMQRWERDGTPIGSVCGQPADFALICRHCGAHNGYCCATHEAELTAQGEVYRRHRKLPQCTSCKTAAPLPDLLYSAPLT